MKNGYFLLRIQGSAVSSIQSLDTIVTFILSRYKSCGPWYIFVRYTRYIKKILGNIILFQKILLGIVPIYYTT